MILNPKISGATSGSGEPGAAMPWGRPGPVDLAGLSRSDPPRLQAQTGARSSRAFSPVKSARGSWRVSSPGRRKLGTVSGTREGLGASIRFRVGSLGADDVRRRLPRPLGRRLSFLD